MFGGKRNSGISEEVETVIGKDTLFKGTITSKSSIRIDGQFEGELVTSGNAVIGQTGSVTAQIKASSCTIAGMVRGNVDVTDRLDLLPTAKLYGDIKVGVLIIGEGAVFKGACEMHGSEAAATKKKE